MIDFLAQHKITADFSNTRQYDVDVTLRDRVIKFEVKNDVMGVKTGNIAIEYYNSNSNKPSGILSTPADVWCHILGTQIWIINITHFKTLIHSKMVDYRILTKVGDGNADIMLFKSSIILSETYKFYRIDDKCTKEVKSILKNI